MPIKMLLILPQVIHCHLLVILDVDLASLDVGGHCHEGKAARLVRGEHYKFSIGKSQSDGFEALYLIFGEIEELSGLTITVCFDPLLMLILELYPQHLQLALLLS